MNNAFQIVGRLGDLTDWTLSNLKFQKALYLCQMFFIGVEQRPLFDEDFEAWDYGPVIPEVYHTLKMFGSSNVKPLSILNGDGVTDEAANDWIGQIADLAQSKTSGKLVSITHWEHGAWSKHYMKGMQGIIIPKASIVEEYNTRLAKRNEKTQQAG